MNRQFTVVEQAGYEGERDIYSFPTLGEALDHMEANYTKEELRSDCFEESLHVAIRQDWIDDHGEEHSEFVY